MGGDSCEPVTAQLDALLRVLQPSRQSEERRGAVFGFVDEVLRKQFDSKMATVEPFCTGSFLSKTYLPDSDLDLTIIHPVGSQPDGTSCGTGSVGGGDRDDSSLSSQSNSISSITEQLLDDCSKMFFGRNFCVVNE